MVFSASSVLFQKSGSAVLASISAMRWLKAASSKTPPCFVNFFKQIVYGRTQFIKHHIIDNSDKIEVFQAIRHLYFF
jgi:hypothetical protein